jgi:hypothetical protein
MDIKTFVKVVSNLPPEIAVLVRGPTGIGKSQIFRSVADQVVLDDGTEGLDVIDRRLAQMTEGDIIGLPELVDGVTRFAPVDWVLRACREPVVLFLDEINRASMEVQQCAFQLVLDREINGHKLHPETRVYAAINAGSEYQVNEMGPALQRRFWTVDLEPTKDDWIEWASGERNMDSVVIDFIRNHGAHLRHVGAHEPGKVYPNPASWDRLERSAVFAGMNPSNLAGKATPSGFYAMCLGFVGVEAAIAFQSFVKDYEIQISAEDILDRFDGFADQISKLKTDKHNGLIEKLIDHCKENDWSLSQAKNATDFIKTLPGEMVVSFFNHVMETNHVPNIKLVHKFIGQLVVEIVTVAEKA